jgi:hypothetical protein
MPLFVIPDDLLLEKKATEGSDHSAIVGSAIRCDAEKLLCDTMIVEDFEDNRCKLLPLVCAR